MTAIGPIVYAFFEQHLKAEKGLSPASVKSYRDALRLFLSFVASERGRSLTRITVEDFTAERVRHFSRSPGDVPRQSHPLAQPAPRRASYVLQLSGTPSAGSACRGGARRGNSQEKGATATDPVPGAR